MNQREYLIICQTLRETRADALEAMQFGYAYDDIKPVLLTVRRLEDKFVDRLKDEYSNFNESEFRKACAVYGA
jgi:hypothetical protein